VFYGWQKAAGAVFLDRDGTLIEDSGYLAHPEEIKYLPGAEEALALLSERFKLFIVTNQPGIARGILTRKQVENVNSAIIRRMASAGARIEEAYYCPHQRSDGCDCIKPRPRFLKLAERTHGIDLKRSFMVGDHPYDVEFAENAGLRGIYVLTGHGRKHLGELPEGVIIAADIKEAAGRIIESLNPRRRHGL
jgi:histidinol-phosphate phosphatase family protein